MLKSVRGSSTGEAVVCGRAANNEAAAEVRMTRPAPAGNAHSNKNINFLADNYTMKKIILVRKNILKFAAAVLFAGSAFFVQAQNAPVELKYSGDRGYSLVERTNLRRYVNGKYVGLTSREVRSFISPGTAPSRKFLAKGSVYEKDQWYDGSFYVMEETLRNNQAASAGVHDSIQSVFHISPLGRLTMYKDNGYPSFRSFPAYTSEKVNPGDSWKSEAERSVDPLNKGVFTKMPMLVAYTFSGEEIYREKEVYRIKAIWQTVYGGSVMDPLGDGSLVKAFGGHKADIIVLKKTGEPVLVVDQVDETFVYTDGSQVNFKGTITLFTEFPPAFDSERIKMAVAKLDDGTGKTGTGAEAGQGAGSDWKGSGCWNGGVVSDAGSSSSGSGSGAGGSSLPVSGAGQSVKSGASKIVTEETPAGLRLSIRDIKFAPDSAEILPSEKERLDGIADVLKMVPKGQFLVEGHTASTGRPAGEQKLSEQRARRIAEELAARGVDAGAFICRGWGGNRSIASNDREEGRAENRRVEITILK